MHRTIILIRHAKSSWNNPDQADFERALNGRGKHDAPLMGSILHKRNILPDLIVSSSAKRAEQTARKIAEAVGYPSEEIQYEEKLYLCEPEIFYQTIASLPADARNVYIIAHNPGITDFVNQLSDTFRIDNMPTCSLTGVRMESAGWAEFDSVHKNVFLFEYPKKYYDSK